MEKILSVGKKRGSALTLPVPSNGTADAAATVPASSGGTKQETKRRGSFWSRNKVAADEEKTKEGGPSPPGSFRKKMPAPTASSYWGGGDEEAPPPPPKKKRWSMWGKSAIDAETAKALPKAVLKKSFIPGLTSDMPEHAKLALAEAILEEFFVDVIDAPTRLLVTNFVQETLTEDTSASASASASRTGSPEKRASGDVRSIASRTSTSGMIYGKKRKSSVKRYLPHLPKDGLELSPTNEGEQPMKIMSDHWLGNLEEQMVPYFDLKHKPATFGRFKKAFRRYAQLGDLLDYAGLVEALAMVTKDKLEEVEMNYCMYLLEVMKGKKDSSDDVAINFDQFVRLASLCEKVVNVADERAKGKIRAVAELTGDLKMLRTKIIWCRDLFFLDDPDKTGFITLEDLTAMMESGRVSESSQEFMTKLLSNGEDDLHFQDFLMYIPYFCGAFLKDDDDKWPSNRASPVDITINEGDETGTDMGSDMESEDSEGGKSPIGDSTPTTRRKRIAAEANFRFKGNSWEKAETIGRNAARTNVISPAVALLMLKKYDEEDRELAAEEAAKALGVVWHEKTQEAIADRADAATPEPPLPGADFFGMKNSKLEEEEEEEQEQEERV